MTAADRASAARPGRPGRGLWVGLALGAPFLVVGGRGVFVDDGYTHPGELARWIVGAAVVHDLALVPAVLAIGWALSRVVPVVVWPAVRWALATSGILVVVAWPSVRGYGRRDAVPSLLPRNYATGLVTAIAVTWLVAGAWAAVRVRRHRRTGHHPGHHPAPR